jgi:hypothetical protein
MAKLVEIEIEVGHVVRITEEQARWLADELRLHRPEDVMGPAQSVAVMLEYAMEGRRGEPDSKPTHEGLRALLDVLVSDRVETAPAPYERLRELRDTIGAYLEDD